MADQDPKDRESTEPSPSEADKRHLSELRKARQARLVKAISILTIIVLLIVFVIQNSDPVPVDFIFVTRRPRLIWVLVVTALLGGVVGYLLGRPGKDVKLHGKDAKKKG